MKKGFLPRKDEQEAETMHVSSTQKYEMLANNLAYKEIKTIKLALFYHRRVHQTNESVKLNLCGTFHTT